MSKRKWQKGVGGKPIINSNFQGRDDVIMWDVLPVQNGDKVRIVFESKNSPWQQGIWLMCDHGIIVEGQKGKSVYLWYDRTPAEGVIVECHATDGHLNVYNVWDRGKGVESQSASSGMLVEDIPHGRRYRCNDIGFDTRFDKLVFRIEYYNDCLDD